MSFKRKLEFFEKALCRSNIEESYLNALDVYKVDVNHSYILKKSDDDEYPCTDDSDDLCPLINQEPYLDSSEKYQKNCDYSCKIFLIDNNVGMYR